VFHLSLVRLSAIYYANANQYTIHLKNINSTNQVQKRGLCRRHGAFNTPEDAAKAKTKKKRVCKFEGCQKCPVAGGYCVGHGGKSKKCKEEGCTNKAVKAGVCMRHGAKQTICKEEGCTKYAQVGGVCRSHGAKLRTCSVEGCTNVAMRVSFYIAGGEGCLCMYMYVHVVVHRGISAWD